MSLRTLLLIYVIGGVTFIPLLFIAFLAYAYFTLPRVGPSTDEPPDAFGTAEKASEDVGFVDKEEVQGTSGTDAAGYFAVCREYVPGGVNGKPPERSTPAGEVLSAESPSVYQSMYRSIFERNKTSASSLDGDRKDPKATKRPRNVFFVVLRHEHLLLFDNADQLEVRHVISLTQHDADVYGGDKPLLEDDMWIKRNCIRLTRRNMPGATIPTSEPFYIFSDNCSEKEDFYHAILAAQARARDTDAPPQPKHFEMDHIIKLVQALHTTDADPHSRWFNALLGRLFLAMYGTEEAERALKAKIDRKVSQAPKPNFIVSIQVQNVKLGDAAPIFSNFKLKELMVDGSLTVEADVKYTGGLRLQIAALARIDLGSRIKAREVDLILAGVVRKLSGHLMIKLKPPPSNRFWISFETMPHLDLSVEPVVSSMQITYGVILRAIESKIREVIGETLVYPNWDDIPFFDTTDYSYRGGIWNVPRSASQAMPVHENEDAATDPDQVPKVEAAKEGGSATKTSILPKTSSLPSLFNSPSKDVTSRKPVRKKRGSVDDDNASTTDSVASAPVTATPTRSRPVSPRLTPADKPKALRVNSFAAAAPSLVSTDDVVQLASSRSSRKQREAVDVVKEVKSRSDSLSAQQRPTTDLSGKRLDRDEAIDGDGVLRSFDEAIADIDIDNAKARGLTDSGKPSDATTQSASIADGGGGGMKKRITWNFGTTPQQASSAIERAATTARSWGINMINRQGVASNNQRKSVSSGFTSLAKEAGLEEEKEEAVSAINPGVSRNSSTSSQGGTGEPESTGAATVAARLATMGQGAMPASLRTSSQPNPSTMKIGPIMRKPVFSAMPPSFPKETARPFDPDDLPAVAIPHDTLAQHHRRTSSIGGGIFDGGAGSNSSVGATTPPGAARSRKSSLSVAASSPPSRAVDGGTDRPRHGLNPSVTTTTAVKPAVGGRSHSSRSSLGGAAAPAGPAVMSGDQVDDEDDRRIALAEEEESTPTQARRSSSRSSGSGGGSAGSGSETEAITARAAAELESPNGRT